MKIKNILNTGEFEIKDNVIYTPEVVCNLDKGLGYHLFHAMIKHKNKITQILPETGEQDTFGDLLRHSIRTAINLRNLHLHDTNSIIVLCTHNHRYSVVPYIAATFLGLRIASLEPTLSLGDTVHLLGQVRPAIIFASEEAEHLIGETLDQLSAVLCGVRVVIFGAQFVDEFLVDVRRDGEEEHFEPVIKDAFSTAAILFSSGTTGLPKGICINSYGILAQALLLKENGLIGAVNMYSSTLYWISTNVYMIASILEGQTRVVCRRFDPLQVWHLIDKYKVFSVFMAPIQALLMTKQGRPDNVTTDSLHVLVTGGGVFSLAPLLQLRDQLPGTFVHQALGQTEVCGIVTCFNVCSVADRFLLAKYPESCGRPIPGVHYKLLDLDTRLPVGVNVKGELLLRTKYALNGYHELDSSDAFTADGWLKTGDIAYYNEDGCFFVVDRIKEMLKYKTWHVSPNWIEGVLNTHPLVASCVVVGIPHEIDGDHAVGVVVLQKGAVIEAGVLAEWVNERVDDERKKLWGGVRFVERLPLTPSGKIRRQDVKRMIIDGII